SLYIGTPTSSISNILVEVSGENYVTNIALKDYLVNLGMDETYQIQASLIPITASTDSLVYESSNTDVLTVDENGLVTPVAPGTAQVKVYSEDYAVFNYVTINVKEVIPLEAIHVSTEVLRMNLGESEKLQLTFVPGNTTKKAVEYSSSNTDAVIVNDAGVATAVGAGSAVITISGEGEITAFMEIVVQVSAESVSFAEDMYVTDLEKEDGTAFYPTILPEESTNKELIWESSNPEVCYVDGEGKLVKVAVGTSQLKATLAGTNLSDVITVAVMDAKADVHIKKMQQNYSNGWTFALTEDGSLWMWGKNINYPKKINLEYVKDFIVGGKYGQSAVLFVLNEAGEVYGYSLYDSGELGNSKWKLIDNIESFSAMSSDSLVTCIAIDKEGTAWAWGYNGYKQIANNSDSYIDSPIQLNTEERILKAIVSKVRVALLSDTGNAYISKDGMFEIAGENVVDIYSLYPGDQFTIDYGDSADVYRDSFGLSQQTKTNNNQKVGSGVVSYYIEEGKVFISDKQIEGIENAADVFCFCFTNYIQTQDGKLYGYGSGEYNAFGNGSSENADTPIRMYLGLQENTNGLSLRTSNFAEEEGYDHRILSDSGIELQFTQALIDGSNYPYITLKDSSGTSLSFVKTMDLNRLTIQPKRALKEGELYTLTIPAGAFTDRAGDSNEEIIIKFHYQKSSSATVKKMMEYDSGSGTFKLAMLQDGSLWIWGESQENQKSVFATPTRLLQAGVSDFVVGPYGDLYVLRNKQVEKYTVDLDDFVNGLTADPTFVLEDSTIVSLSSEQRNSGLCYAVAEDGSVYGWQNRSSEAPVKITIPAAVEKVVSTTSGAGFYTADGSVYAAADLQNTPVLIGENAADLYAAEDDSDLYIVQADTFIRWHIAEGEGEALTRTNEEIIGSHGYYISGGRVHFRNNNGGWFTNTEYGSGDSPAVTCVSRVFDFGDNVYIQTAYGTVYAIGSGDNYALGQGNKDSSAAPVPLHFDGADSDAAETAAVKKMMTRTTDGAKERYALRADGSLLMWGGSHSTPEMLFENSVQDFIIYENQLYVLDDSGMVKRYTASSGDFVYTMQEDETFMPVTGIRFLSSEKESTGVFFAVGNSGSVYGWGKNDCGQLGTGEAGEPVAEPTEVPVGMKIRKVICTEDGVAFLTKTGRLIVRSFAAEGLEAGT
ncbi:MAG: Ig-like domain-containing protein, partial [Anaerovoracaceae bacterium]